MSLAARRFPDRIVRRREGPGARDRHGEYQPGAVVETEFPASVQPLALADNDIAGGAILADRVKVFIPVPDALAAAGESMSADHVVLADGRDFVVEESRSWPRSHTRATLLREL